MNKFLDTLCEVITAAAKAAEEERSRTLAMEMISMNTKFLDQFARDLVRDLSKFNTTSYFARRQIEAMNLRDDETTYLKRRIISEAVSVDYYARSQTDAILRTL